MKRCIIYRPAIILLAFVFTVFAFPALAEERASAFLTIQTQSDLDLHGHMPWGLHVYYAAPADSRGSFLTNDANVENDTARAGALERIYFPLVPGLYRFQVHNFLDRASGNNPYILQFQLGSTLKTLPGVLGGTNTAKDHFLNVTPNDLKTSMNGGRQDLHPSTQFSLFSGPVHQAFHGDKRSAPVQKSSRFSTSNGRNRNGSSVRINTSPNSRSFVGNSNGSSPLGHTAQYLNGGFQGLNNGNSVQALNRIEPAAGGQAINASQVASGLALNRSAYGQANSFQGKEGKIRLKTNKESERIGPPVKTNGWAEFGLFKLAERVAVNHLDNNEIRQIMAGIKKVRVLLSSKPHYFNQKETKEKRISEFVRLFSDHGLNTQQLKNLWQDWYGGKKRVSISSHLAKNYNKPKNNVSYSPGADLANIQPSTGSFTFGDFTREDNLKASFVAVPPRVVIDMAVGGIVLCTKIRPCSKQAAKVIVQLAKAVSAGIIKNEMAEEIANEAESSPEEAQEQFEQAKQESQAAAGAPDPDPDDDEPKKKKKAEGSEEGDNIRTPDTHSKDFVKLKNGQGYKNKNTSEIWQKSFTSHRGDVWKVGRNGQPPRKAAKISVRSDGKIVKID